MTETWFPIPTVLSFLYNRSGLLLPLVLSAPGCLTGSFFGLIHFLTSLAKWLGVTIKNVLVIRLLVEIRHELSSNGTRKT